MMSRFSKKFSCNKTPRYKQRGIKSALQAAGFQPAFAPRVEELDPKLKSHRHSEINTHVLRIVCRADTQRQIISSLF